MIAVCNGLSNEKCFLIKNGTIALDGMPRADEAHKLWSCNSMWFLSLFAYL